jgi:hypothetical protein
MVASFTPNVQLTEPARGDDVGTWDTPVNGNTTLLDLIVGGIATVTLNNSNVVLSAAQFQCRNITFVSTLTGTVTVTLPTSFTKSYEIQNLCTGSSAFTIGLNTTAAGGQGVGCPPGQTVDVFNDGTNIKFKNLPAVGTYSDFATATVPLWLSACSVPPWLNCAGGTFSATTYPALNVYLGGNTLPDCRGTVSAALDQGAGRLTNISSIFTVGGDQNLQSHTHTNTVGNESASHTHAMNSAAFVVGGGPVAAASGGSFEGIQGPFSVGPNTGTESAAHNHIVTIANAGAGAGQNLQPTTVVGIRMIRAG